MACHVRRAWRTKRTREHEMWAFVFTCSPRSPGSRCSRISEGHSTLQDDVRVRGLLPGPPDGPDPKERILELLVRNMLQRGRAQELPRGLVEGGTALPHLLGDGGRLYLELIQDRLQRLREGRHSRGQGQIDAQHRRRNWKTAVGDDEPVGVAHGRNHPHQFRMENAALLHQRPLRPCLLCLPGLPSLPGLPGLPSLPGLSGLPSLPANGLEGVKTRQTWETW